MGIVSSSYQADATTQIDGRVYVTETHTDNLGIVRQWVYLAAVGANKDTILAQHAAQLADQLEQEEIGSLLNGDPA